jgi:very-short-patch-repair endonuclease
MNNYFLKYPKSTLDKARKLRRNITEAEKKLWRLLRYNQLGVHFRRQVPLGPYVLDFFCFQAKLVVELDGSQHYFSKIGIKSDSKRDTYLKKQGLTILRFNNKEFLRNPFGVLQVIYEHIQEELSASSPIS